MFFELNSQLTVYQRIASAFKDFLKFSKSKVMFLLDATNCGNLNL